MLDFNLELQIFRQKLLNYDKICKYIVLYCLWILGVHFSDVAFIIMMLKIKQKCYLVL